ncbi:hypothetical protein HAP47_0026050 [Bradyrhizobium sp. 41S5]|uniref:hypothetical protein n=1 Tax=Bradyrhizobium sp. 41S5 TaxID=1404443 RepID=UPI00156BAEDC|nr:hypothetical protein [Bradyrhizobium sp. 41S5]UFX42687.1 hypothetical protein HAP47_0026050 [Bradyrhizobium sp. 41S5]
MKENVRSERPIHQVEAPAEGSPPKRNPIEPCDLGYGDSESDKSLENNDFNGCRSYSHIEETMAKELLAPKYNRCQREKSKKKKVRRRHWVIGIKGKEEKDLAR